MTLLVDVHHRRGEFELEARFEAGAGVTALFGPSGSGKTTLLDLIAGLERPETGRIAINGETLVDTAAGTWVPSHRRKIGYVFQDNRLFPHLSVRQNLDYGSHAAGKRGEAPQHERIVALLGLGALLDRRPGTLSGGEKQRVAIGRALLSAPRLLLLDEPMASVDTARRAEILPYLARVREEAGIPIVYVSHTLAEVARLADTVVLLEAGRVSAIGPVAELLSRLDLGEASQGAEAGAVLTATVAAPEVKEVTGTGQAVTVTGPPQRHEMPQRQPVTVTSPPQGKEVTATGQAVTVTGPPQRHEMPQRQPVTVTSSSITVLHHPAGEFRVPWTGQEPGTIVRLHVLARDVALAIGELGPLSIRNRLAATIVEISEIHGGVREIRLDAGGEALLARVTAETVAEMGLRPGLRVTALIKSVALER